MTWRRGDVALAAAATGVAALCVGFGVWQVDRHAERRARNAQLAARLALPPLEIGGASAINTRPDSVHQRRVTARGTLDYGRERVRPGRTFQGTPGVALLTPLRLEGGGVVFVDRGWVPSPDAFHVDTARFREPATADVVGLALRAPRGRGDIDPAALGDTLRDGVLPFVIQQTEPASTLPSHLPRRWPPPELSSGPHLGYAVQWFSFALVALVGTALLLRNRGKRPHTRGLGQ